MITVHCRICGREFTTEKGWETGWGDLMTRIGIHVKTHPDVHADLARKMVLLTGYLMLRTCVRPPEDDAVVMRHLAELRGVVEAAMRETTEAAEKPN